jgi:hypothetical protein
MHPMPLYNKLEADFDGDHINAIPVFSDFGKELATDIL